MSDGTSFLVFQTALFGALYFIARAYEMVLRRYTEPTMRRDLTMAGATSAGELPLQLRQELHRRRWILLLYVPFPIIAFLATPSFPGALVDGVVLALSFTVPPGLAFGILFYFAAAAARKQRPLPPLTHLHAALVGGIGWAGPFAIWFFFGHHVVMADHLFGLVFVYIAWRLLAINYPRAMYRKLVAAYEWREDARAPR